MRIEDPRWAARVDHRENQEDQSPFGSAHGKRREDTGQHDVALRTERQPGPAVRCRHHYLRSRRVQFGREVSQ
jgi:hypothetical protein